MNQKAKQQKSWKEKKRQQQERQRGEYDGKNETGLELKAMM